MRRLSLLVLLAMFAACQQPTPPAPATPEAIGIELATFPQVLVPISTQAWANMQTRDGRADQYSQPYAHGSLLVDGRETPVSIAYTSVWLAHAPIPLQPMSVRQYLRVFEGDTETDLARVIAPQGNIFFTRKQLPAVRAAAETAGAGPTDLPYSLVHGTGR